MDWQIIVVALIVLLATVYLVRRFYRSFQRPACQDCENCAHKALKPEEKLVQLRIPGKSSKKLPNP